MISTDKPSGNGDHENFFANKNNYVYGADGSKYRNCTQIAMQIRSVDTQTPWYALKKTILFSTNVYEKEKNGLSFLKHIMTNKLNPSFGYVTYRI